MWQGSPARFVRVMPPEERAKFGQIASHYAELAARYRIGLRGYG
jgi:carbonic anhydrase/acetyltransferase-like protein (isoleucine patch superfamily)